MGINFSSKKSPIAKMKIHMRMPFVMLDKTSFSPPDVVCMTSDDADPNDRIMWLLASPAPLSASFTDSPNALTISDPPFVTLARESPIAIPMFWIRLPLPFECIFPISFMVFRFADSIDRSGAAWGGRRS